MPTSVTGLVASSSCASVTSAWKNCVPVLTTAGSGRPGAMGFPAMGSLAMDQAITEG